MWGRDLERDWGWKHADGLWAAWNCQEGCPGGYTKGRGIELTH